MEQSKYGDSGGRFAASVWFPRPREVEIRPEALPPVGPDEVRVRAIASAISHGTEMLVYRGEVAPNLDLDLPTLRGGFGFPIKYGYASVGRVAARGPAVRGLAEGDLVFALHPHQTAYVVPARYTLKLPASLAPEAGVFAANLETAVNVLLDAPVRLAEAAVIFGQGVVGRGFRVAVIWDVRSRGKESRQRAQVQSMGTSVRLRATTVLPERKRCNRTVMGPRNRKLRFSSPEKRSSSFFSPCLPRACREGTLGGGRPRLPSTP